MSFQTRYVFPLGLVLAMVVGFFPSILIGQRHLA